jgi:hypothetical protein
MYFISSSKFPLRPHSFEISDSHGGEYEDDIFMKYSAV